jgi:stage III sporulation protein AD
MDIFLKIIACIFVSVTVCLVLSKQNKDIATLLSIGVCCMVATVAFSFFQPVIDFLSKLQDLTGVDENLFMILTKTVGIALVGEVASMICNDAGYGAMGKVLQILSACVVLWLSLPLFTKLIELIESVLNS